MRDRAAAPACARCSRPRPRFTARAWATRSRSSPTAVSPARRRGFCVGHVGPEAAVGGPIALLRDGDIIELDADNGTLNVKLSDDELAKRKAQWKPRETEYGSGYLWKYAQQVGPAVNGAVTHPGGKAEKISYADQ